jgi:hypothetical protein
MRGYARISDYDLRVNCDNISSVMRHRGQDKNRKKNYPKPSVICSKMRFRILNFVETKVGDAIFVFKEKYINSTELMDNFLHIGKEILIELYQYIMLC